MDTTTATGLRTVHAAPLASQRDLFMPQTLTTIGDDGRSQIFEGFLPATQLTAPTVKREDYADNEQKKQQLDEWADSKEDQKKKIKLEERAHRENWKIFGQIKCDRSKLRRWRMSEPVAVRFS